MMFITFKVKIIIGKSGEIRTSTLEQDVVEGYLTDLIHLIPFKEAKVCQRHRDT